MQDILISYSVQLVTQQIKTISSLETIYDGIYSKMNNTGISQNIFLFSYRQETRKRTKNNNNNFDRMTKCLFIHWFFTSRILNSIFCYMNYFNAQPHSIFIEKKVISKIATIHIVQRTFTYVSFQIYVNDKITMARHMAIATVIPIKILRFDTVVFVKNICF